MRPKPLTPIPTALREVSARAAGAAGALERVGGGEVRIGACWCKVKARESGGVEARHDKN